MFYYFFNLINLYIMYISKKILVLFLLVFSFIFWMVYASSNITWLTDTVNEWDTITAEYYNKLNWNKVEWWTCKYSWWKLMCIDF